MYDESIQDKPGNACLPNDESTSSMRAKGLNAQTVKTNARQFCFFQLFRYADGLDIFLMVVGILLAVAQGAASPLTLLYLYAQILNAMMAFSPCFADARNAMDAISVANATGAMGRLPLEVLAFMNSSQFEQIKNYKSLSSGPGYSLFGEVGTWSGYYTVVGLGNFITGSLHIACWTVAGQRQIGRVQSKLFRAILSKDASWFDSRRTGELNNVLFEMIRKMEEGMTSKISITTSWVVNAVLGFVVAFVTNWLIAIVIFSLAPLLFLVGFMMIRLVRSYSTKQTAAYGEAGAIANEVLGNLRTVLAFNRQEYEVKRYQSQVGLSQRMGIFKIVSSGISQGLVALIINSLAGLAFWWGNNPQVHEAGGNVMMIFVCVMISTTHLANAVPNFENIATALAGADEIFTIIDEASLIDNFSEEGRKLQEIKGEVAFNDVSFAYPSSRDRPVLKSFSLTLLPGQTVALVGMSGCGKSTVAQLLMRYYDVSGGKIAIDGIDISLLNVRWLRQQIGLVSQEPVLFNTSIKENIRLGALSKPNVADEAIIEACKLSNAHGFISAFPNGYDTMVGERGAQLSGGQKQRIAIARALISNPKILVLDEATSALDTTSEKVVQQALDNARVGRTTILIAHRLSTIRNADLIAVIDRGLLVEIGDHDALMAKDGHYSLLVKTQRVEVTNDRAKITDSDEISFKGHDIVSTSNVCISNGASFRHSGKVSKIDSDVEKGNEEDVKAAKKASKPSRFRLMKTVLNWGRPELKLTLICALVSAILGAVQTAYSIIVSEFLGSFCPGDTETSFSMFLGIIIGFGAFQALLTAVQHYLFSLIAERLTQRIRCRLLGKFLRMDAGWLDRQENQPSILITSLATDCIDIQGLSGVRISIYVLTMVIVGIAVVYSLVFEYRLALALLGLMPLILISAVFYSQIAMGGGKNDTADGKSANQNAIVAMDAIANMRTIMALGAEQFFLDRFMDQRKGIQRTAIRRGILSGPLLSLSSASVFWCGAITFCLGSWLMQNRMSEFLKLIHVYMLITFCGMTVGRSANAVADEEKARKAAAKLQAIFDVQATIDVEDDKGQSTAAKQLATNPKLAQQCSGRIEFKNASFSYPTRPNVQVLKNISFTVEPGQRVALCGPSGGGKSTTMQLIQRLYDPTTGSVMIDGVNIKEANIRAVRSNIGLVAQEPILFALNVEENISFGARLASEKPTALEIENACKQANAFEFLQKLPEGLKSMVGERGAKLSGGQKQRVAIARALVRKPPILLLDEATSALDTESERIVQEALDAASYGRTTLTIAHRLSTIRNSDKILVLANGTIVEQGTHDELMSLHGVYFDLHSSQSGKSNGESP